MRRHDRLARATLRGIFLIGGVLGAWGVYDAIAGDGAHAAAAPRACLVDELLDGIGTLLGSSLSCTPRPASGPVVGDGPSRLDKTAQTTPAPKPRDDARSPARTEPGPVVRVLGPRPTTVPTPARRVAGTSAAADVGDVVAAIRPVTREVVDLASPVPAVSAEAELLEPVGAVVRPAAQPVAVVLAPVLDPVLDLARPILGPPAAPRIPPGGPTLVAATPAGPGTAATGSATGTRVASAPPVVTTPIAPPAWDPAAGGEPAAGSAAPIVPWNAERGSGHGPMPGGPGCTAGNSQTGGGTGATDDAWLSARAPELLRRGWYGVRAGKLADRCRQPETRPA
ncbi:hypothetical protein [Micromonospora deserti]|uniref:hypothetical protein n=1 Tax=Micromonospora deserti TaxID=2070366 RepID=UPI0011B6D9D0|nr:hypothetical protein [Micromonospora deserti]